MNATTQLLDPALDLELLFCTDVLKLGSLHYGYWDQSERVDLEGIRRAQARYTNTLLALVPPGVRTVLDVGCGVGDIAAALARRGHQVTALSPDENHAQFFRCPERRRIRFRPCRFEDFDTPERFDLVLMSESQDYFDAAAGLARAAGLLNPGGYLLVSGMFRRERASAYESCQVESEYVAQAEAQGFRLLRRVDITANVLPTLEYAGRLYQEFGRPLAEMVGAYADRRLRLRARMLRWLFARELRQLGALQRYYDERLDARAYREKMVYVRVLFTAGGRNEVHPAG